MMDRWVQQMLLQELQPISDPMFSEHSYGFRPGRSAHEAVRAAREQVSRGKSWVVDLDITKFFDRVHHDILLRRIGKYLRSGAGVGQCEPVARAGTATGSQRDQKRRGTALGTEVPGVSHSG